VFSIVHERIRDVSLRHCRTVKGLTSFMFISKIAFFRPPTNLMPRALPPAWLHVISNTPTVPVAVEVRTSHRFSSFLNPQSAHHVGYNDYFEVVTGSLHTTLLIKLYSTVCSMPGTRQCIQWRSLGHIKCTKSRYTIDHI
jgi:hypothetical protein